MNYKALIIAVSSLVLAIIAGSLWAGIATREVTVVEHPYEDGLKYDQTQKRYADLGWKVVAPSSLDKSGRLEVKIYGKDGAPLDAGSVEFALNRLGSSEIKKYRAPRDGGGSYGARVDCPLPGYWELKVQVTRGADTLSYDSRLHIDG